MRIYAKVIKWPCTFIDIGNLSISVQNILLFLITKPTQIVKTNNIVGFKICSFYVSSHKKVLKIFPTGYT